MLGGKSKMIAELESRLASAEEAAKFNKDIIRAIDDYANLGVWFAYFNEKGENDRVEFTDVFRRMLNVTRSEFPDTSEAFQAAVHPDDAPAMWSSFGAALADTTNRTKYDVVLRMMVKNQGYKRFRAIGQVMRDKNSAPLLFVGSFERVEEKLQMEEEMKTSKNRQFAVDKMMLEGSWSIDLTKYKIDDIKAPMVFSDQFKKLIGYERNSPEFPDIMQSWMTRIHPDDVGEASALIGKQLANPHENIPFDMMYRIRHRSGEYKWFRASSYIVWNEDRTAPVMAAGTILDVTDEQENKARFVAELRPAIDNLASEINSVSERVGLETANTVAVSDKQKSISEAASSIEKSVDASMGIIDQIKSLADQTNILSLNASIEAARAGAAGKGFAVVAAEVRRLADSTAEVTSNISDLLMGMNGEIKSVISQISDINRNIEEQSNNMLEINNTVDRLNELSAKIGEMTMRLYKD